MPSESTISNSDLMSRLSAKDTKKCYKNWTRGCKAAICGLCNVEVALSGNTTNGKRHLVNHHIEVVHSLLKGTSTTGNQQKEKTSQSLNAGQVSSRKRSAPASTVQEVAIIEEEVDDIEVVTEQNEEEVPNSSKKSKTMAMTSHFGTKQRVILNYGKQPDITDYLNAARQIPSTKVEVLDTVLQFIVRNGIVLSQVTSADIEPLTKILPHQKLPTPEELKIHMRDKAKCLRPIISKMVRNASHWTLDLQHFCISSDTYLVVVFAILIGEDLVEETPCILSTFIRTSNAEPSSEELKLVLLNASAENELPLKSAVAAFHFTDNSNSAIRSVLGNHIPLLECYLIKLGQLMDIVAHNPQFIRVVTEVEKLILELLKSQSGQDEVQAQCKKSEMDFEILVDCFVSSSANDLASFYKVKVISEFKEMLISSLANPVFSDIMFTNSSLSVCVEMYTILSKVESSRQAASKEVSLYASQFCPRLHFLKKNISSTKLHTSAARDVQNILVTKLADWIGTRRNRVPYASAQFMDPRCKGTMHIQDHLATSQIRQELKKDLLQLITDNSPREIDTNEEEGEADENAGQTTRMECEDSDLVDCFDLADFCPSGSSANNHSKAEIETSYLTTFLNDSTLLPSSTDLSNFWNERSKAEPFLAKLALQKLGFPGKRNTFIGKIAHSRSFGKQSQREIKDYLLLASISNNLWRM